VKDEIVVEGIIESFGVGGIGKVRLRRPDDNLYLDNREVLVKMSVAVWEANHKPGEVVYVFPKEQKKESPCDMCNLYALYAEKKEKPTEPDWVKLKAWTNNSALFESIDILKTLWREVFKK